ncbi:MAG: carboxypeptidase regulatory-like domain-containing protein [Myxococcales bacterium]|nr:carboxypeptidase regulatory-like domain-containing protein [Myxococcales bacterium]
MSRGQTTLGLAVVAALAIVVGWRWCGAAAPSKSADRRGFDAGVAPPIDAAARRVIAPRPSPPAPGASRITFVTLDVGSRAALDHVTVAVTAAAATGRDAAVTAGGGAVQLDVPRGEVTLATSASGPLAVVGATALVVGGGPVHGVAVLVGTPEVAAASWPAPEVEPVATAATATAAILGFARVDGALAEDFTVEVVQLGTFGPGHPVAHDRPPGLDPEPRLAPRRYLGTMGRFEVADLQPGSYLVVVTAPGRGAALRTVAATPGPPAEAVVELPPAASIGGTVRDQDDAPIAGARVALRVDDRVLRRAVSDRRGVWLLDAVPVTGDGALEVDASGCVADPLPVALTVDRTTRVLVATCR